MIISKKNQLLFFELFSVEPAMNLRCFIKLYLLFTRIAILSKRCCCCVTPISFTLWGLELIPNLTWEFLVGIHAGIRELTRGNMTHKELLENSIYFYNASYNPLLDKYNQSCFWASSHQLGRCLICRQQNPFEQCLGLIISKVQWGQLQEARIVPIRHAYYHIVFSSTLFTFLTA